MNGYLRDRLLQKLDTLSDERAYQVLDFVEFLESRYAERSSAAENSALSRFADAVEERLRAGRVSATAIAETMGLMSRAIGVLNGAAAAGRTVATDLVSATSRVMDAAAAAAAPRPSTPANAGVRASGTTGAQDAAAPAPPPDPAAGPSSGGTINPS